MLHCRRCRADFTCPIWWEEYGDDRWLVHLHCGQCGHQTTDIFEDAETQEFDNSLEVQGDMIRDDLSKLRVAQQADWTEAFARALEENAIVPDDFVPPGTTPPWET